MYSSILKKCFSVSSYDSFNASLFTFPLFFAFLVKKEEALKRSLEEKNSQIYIERSKVIHRILLGGFMVSAFNVVVRLKHVEQAR